MKKLSIFVILCLITVSVSACGTQSKGQKTTKTASNAFDIQTSPVVEQEDNSLISDAIADRKLGDLSSVVQLGIKAGMDTEQKELNGIVLDAAMHSVTIQTKELGTLSFSIPDECDTTQLSQGLLIGEPVVILYCGTIQGNDTSNIELQKIADSSETPSLTRDELSAAADIILAVENKDLTGLSQLMNYPCYVGLGEGTIVENAEQLIALGADHVFTDELINTVAHVDLMAVEKVEAGIVLGDGRPNVTFDRMDNQSFGITGINY